MRAVTNAARRWPRSDDGRCEATLGVASDRLGLPLRPAHDVPRSIAKMKGGALSLLANASANVVSIQSATLMGPRANIAPLRGTRAAAPRSKRSGFGESAALAIAGTVTHSAVSNTRVRKPSSKA